MELPERLLDKIVFDPISGCWLWIGARTKRGYGTLGIRLAHRVVYESVRGPIPRDLEIDHLCRVHACVNPNHLEPVTHLVNIRRGEGGARRAALQSCPYGHPYDEKNTRYYPQKSGKLRRYCRACNRKRTRGWRRIHYKCQTSAHSLT